MNADLTHILVYTLSDGSTRDGLLGFTEDEAIGKVADGLSVGRKATSSGLTVVSVAARRI